MVEDNLVFATKEIKINTFEQKVLTSLEDLILNKQKVVICYPNKDFFLTLALQLVLKDYIKNYKYKDNFKKRTSVLVITNKKRALDLLQNLYIESSKFIKNSLEKHKVFREREGFCNLDDAYNAQCNWNHILNVYYSGKVPELIPFNFLLPISIGYFSFKQLSRGTRNKIGRRDNKQGSVLYITDNLNVLKNLDIDVDYVLIDFSSINKFMKFAKQEVLYYFDTPFDDRIVYLINDSTQFWNFDAKLLSHIPKENINDKTIIGNKEYSIGDLTKQKNIEKININNIKSEFEDEIFESLDLLNKLSKKNFDSYDLRIISSILYNAIRLPISAMQYDLIAELEIIYDPINELINELRDSENRYEDEDFERLLVLIEDIFNKKGLDKESPKFREITKLLISEINKNRKVGFIITNKIVSLALKEQLSNMFRCSISDLESKGIYFYDKKKVLKGIDSVECDCLIIYSAINLVDLQILENSKYQKAVIYLYKIEMLLLENKLKKLMNSINHGSKLIGSTELNSMYRYIYNRIKQITLKDNRNKDFINETELIIQNKGNVISARKKRMYKGKNAIKAKLIEFNDGSYMFINGEFKVRALNRQARKYELRVFSQLKNGNELLFIDNDVRRELFEVFIRNMDKNENSIKCYYLIQKWRLLYEEQFYNNRLNDEQLYKKMKNNGWDKTTKAILKNWRSGYSYGPRDFEDIICLGKVLAIDEFIENAQLYYNAMQYVRKERRKAARLLNNYIFASKSNREKSLSTLEAYNLSIEQLDEAIKVKRIKNIHKRIYYIKPSELGILFED
jgi:hypothetical protein